MKITNKTVFWLVLISATSYPIIHYVIFGIDFEKPTLMSVWFMASALIIFVGVIMLFFMLYDDAIYFEYDIKLPWQKSEKQIKTEELLIRIGKESQRGNEGIVKMLLQELEELES